MGVLTDRVDRNDPTFVANRGVDARAAGRARRAAGDRPRRWWRALHRAPPGPGQAHRPRAHRSAARPRLPLPRALAARRLGQRLHRRRQPRDRHRHRAGHRVRHLGQRSHRQGRHLQPVHLEEVVPRLRHRVRQPHADDPVGRVRRRRPADPVGDLPARRSQLPRPHPAQRSGHPHHRPGVRQLHGRRRLRARAVRPRRDGQGRRQGVPRRSAAREDGHRRRGHRRGAGRSRDARPHEWPRRPPRRRRDGLHPHRARHRAPPRVAQARPVTAHRPPGCAPLRRGRSPGPRAGRPPPGLRPPGRAGPRARRLGLRRVQAAVRAEPRDRLGRAVGLPGRRPRQRPGRAVQRGERQGHPVHPAGQPGRRAAALPAEHHGLHGRAGVRAARAWSRTARR